MQTFDVKSGNTKNQSNLTDKPYWGREIYGLDYRDRIKNAEGTVQEMMKQRVEDWNNASFESDECGPDNQIVKNPNTILTSNGDDFEVDQTIEKDAE